MTQSKRVLLFAVCTLALVVPAATGIAQAAKIGMPQGEPNSVERQAYCEARQSTCVRDGNNAYCRSNPNRPPNCLADVQDSCGKDFLVCLGGQSPTTNPSPPPPSPTPTSSEPMPCDVLVADMLAYVRENKARRIHVVWMTNYFANGTRFAGVTDLMLRGQGRTLVGEGQRRRTAFGGHHVEVENVSLRIRYDLKVVFQNTYGPYGMKCSANKFAVVYTGDSVETFNFKFPPQ